MVNPIMIIRLAIFGWHDQLNKCHSCCYIVYRSQTNLLFYFPSFLQERLFHIQNKSIFFAYILIILLIYDIIVYLYGTASTWSEWTKRVLLEIIILPDTEYIFYLILSNEDSMLWEKIARVIFWSQIALMWIYNK